jgi:hypothetical protein
LMLCSSSSLIKPILQITLMPFISSLQFICVVRLLIRICSPQCFCFCFLVNAVILHILYNPHESISCRTTKILQRNVMRPTYMYLMIKQDKLSVPCPSAVSYVIVSPSHRLHHRF